MKIIIVTRSEIGSCCRFTLTTNSNKRQSHFHSTITNGEHTGSFLALTRSLHAVLFFVSNCPGQLVRIANYFTPYYQTSMSWRICHFVLWLLPIAGGQPLSCQSCKSTSRVCDSLKLLVLVTDDKNRNRCNICSVS